jgi:crossover junction endodeoxyribonuclease RuvC
MLAMGVDPGSRVTGYGLVEKNSPADMTLVDSGYISAVKKAPFYERIHHIFQGIMDVMKTYRPDEMAIEDIFYAKNVKSALKLGHARGAVLVAGVQCGAGIFEYTPLEIKKSVVGYGGATKEQVRSMVQVILRTKKDLTLDTSDALATAICHLNWSRFETSLQKKNCR